jgi:hypothetical protein
MPSKPLGRKAYGSIGHLPSSRLGSGDHCVTEGQARICCVRARDKHDRIIVQQKLDGTNAAVARIDGQIVPLQRKGYPALSSPYEQHRLFAAWVFERQDRFAFLDEGERLCGEWLAQAHGTRYALPHEPFVAFDLMIEDRRAPYEQFVSRLAGRFVLPELLSDGPPISVEIAYARATISAHGAQDKIEGCVWRVERKGVVDYLAKWVNPDKIDGLYLPGTEQSISKVEVWNWRPGDSIP